MTKSIRPYISLDLETTGLNIEKVQILQIGAVLDNGISDIGNLRKYNVLIKNPIITYGESFALSMNSNILKKIHSKPTTVPVIGLEDSLQGLISMLAITSKLAKDWDVKQGFRPREKVQFAGKNVANFDIPIIENQLKLLNDPILIQMFKKYVDHRAIDVGAIFFVEFGRNAGLGEINKLIGRNKVSHDALDDALDVVHAIRYKINPSKRVKLGGMI